jgi:hypothetical protein
MNSKSSFARHQVAGIQRAILRRLVFMSAGAPALLLAQYSEIKMGEHLHYAVVAANGGVCAAHQKRT